MSNKNRRTKVTAGRSKEKGVMSKSDGNTAIL